ncbi:MAG TPA: phage BR0599 family protein [Verrucomicrobiae bacterium]|nr:phage BR0599 family protein [Verrucomicrobiae bacterium]
MKEITLDGLYHYAWVYELDWASGVSVRFRLETDQVASLTKRQERAAFSEALKVTDVQATYCLDQAAAAEVRNALRVLQDTPVRLPFLPGVDRCESFLARWYQAWDSGEGAGAVENLAFGLVADGAGRKHVAPTLLGYLVEPPTFELLTTELVNVGLRWKESADFSERLQVPACEWEEGPRIGARVVYRFPFAPDWSQSQDAGAVVVDVDRKDVGFRRRSASAAYPQVGSRQPVFGFTLDGGEASTLLRFFQDRRGPTEPFWLPCWVGECRLAEDALAADTEITVTDATALGEHRYIILLSAGAPVERHITDIEGNVLTLDQPLGMDMDAVDTVLSALALVRFSSGELVVKWDSPDCTECQIQFEEVSQEYMVPAGDVYGGTFGPLANTCFLFQLNTAGQSWYWTNYEKDLNYGGQAYASEDIEFDEIAEGVAWESNEVSVSMRSWVGNPVLSLLARTATDRMELIIARGVPNDPVIGYTVLFRGWITKADMKGAWLTATAASFGSLFERNVPRTIMQTCDNYALFDAGNRLTRASWTFTARLTAMAGLVLTFDTLTWPQGALPVIGANYLALGYVERPVTHERVLLVSSTALVAGALTATVSHAFMGAAPVAPEAGWLLVPGYDGLLETAVAKFNNAANFGGFPFMPDVNPSLVAMPSNRGGSSKKG